MTITASSTTATTDPATPYSLITRDDLRLAPVMLDLYKDIHKGIRAELFAVTAAAGRTDPADAAARAELNDQVRALAHLLDLHAQHEDSAIEPALVAWMPDLAELISVDHALFDRRVYGLVTCAESAAAAGPSTARAELHELYLGLAAFTGSYLGHIDLEERVIMPGLERAIGVDGVMQIHGAIVGSMPPDDFARGLAAMMPAMNIDDRVDMLAGMRMGAPAEVFAGVLGTVGTLIGEAGFTALTSRLGE